MATIKVERRQCDHHEPPSDLTDLTQPCLNAETIMIVMPDDSVWAYDTCPELMANVRKRGTRQAPAGSTVNVIAAETPHAKNGRKGGLKAAGAPRSSNGHAGGQTELAQYFTEHMNTVIEIGDLAGAINATPKSISGSLRSLKMKRGWKFTKPSKTTIMCKRVGDFPRPPRGRGLAMPKANGTGNGDSAKERGLDPKAIRTWARKKHIKLPAKGRIPTGILDRYEADLATVG